MNERIRPQDAVALAVALACVVAVGLLNDRQKTRSSQSYSTYDASPGGYRAWYELLQREGVAAARFERQAAFLDGSTTTLVIADSSASSAERVDSSALDAWVRAGGRLVVLGDGAAVGALRSSLRLPHTANDSAESSRRIAPELRAAGVERLSPVTARRLEPRAGDAVLAEDAQGRLIVRYGLGRGSVTYAIDGAAFTNRSIVAGDHARLAVALTRPAGAGLSAFDEAIHGYLIPEHWWAVLPRPFVAAVVAACAVLAIALFGSAVRLGPPQAAAPSRQATSAEYLDAVAALYRSAGARRKALDDALTAARRLAARASLPERPGGSLDALERLAQRPATSDPDLVAGVALAVSLRRELTKHAGRG